MIEQLSDEEKAELRREVRGLRAHLDSIASQLEDVKRRPAQLEEEDER